MASIFQMAVVALAKNQCLFDFVYITRPENFPKDLETSIKCCIHLNLEQVGTMSWNLLLFENKNNVTGF